MQITILGCGGSLGVPQLLCKCYVCTSASLKNKRRRASIYIKEQETSVLVDTSPDVKYQLLDNNISHLDAIIFTHDHSDHVAGIDEIRAMCPNRQPIDAYIDDETFATLGQRYKYIFKNESDIYFSSLHRKKLANKFSVNNLSFESFLQIHGDIISRGLICGDFVYSTDFHHIPEESLAKLSNVKLWIIDCLRYSYSISHSYLEKTLTLIDKIKPERAILTHMGHDIDYAEINEILPRNVVAAYDNMQIKL